MMGKAPSVAQAKITDPAGNVLFVSPGLVKGTVLDPAEKAQIQAVRADWTTPRVFSFGKDRWEAVAPILFGTQVRGFAWVESDRRWDRAQLLIVVRGTFVFGVVWIMASTALAWAMSRLISRPLAILHAGTKALMTSPDTSSGFPLPMTADDEFGDLIRAFNGMVASIEEQRSGLNDTLSLLDSMLANAPIGLAFFDRRCRCIRVNHVFAEMSEVPLNRHLGKTLPELLPEPVGRQLEEAVNRAFLTEAPQHGSRSKAWAASRGSPGPGWSAPIRFAPRPARCAGPA